MKQLTKEQYIKLFEFLRTSEGFKKSFAEFINTYDGTNEAELFAFIAQLISLVAEHERALIKAVGYDEIKEKQQEFERNTKEIRDSYEAVMKGAAPPKEYVDDSGNED